MKASISQWIISICVISIACSSEDPAKNSHTVHVAGRTMGGTSRAIYWKDGEQLYLTDGSKAAIAYAVTVYEGDVYVAGYEGALAVYWKNGEVIPLTNGTGGNGIATSIVVNETGVYVAGYHGARAVYWANGTPHFLGESGKETYAYDIEIVGEDVYVVGYENTTPILAHYWKNGVSMPLAEYEGAVATGIVVDDGDVYISGYTVPERDAVYWKNGAVVPLPESLDEHSEAHEIAIDRGVLYATGRDGANGVYWKNGTSVPLTAGVAYSIAVRDGDVYVAGQGPNGAVYWKNGEEIPLQIGARAESITVSN